MFSLLGKERTAQAVLQAAREVLGSDLEALAVDPGAAYLNRVAQPLIVAAAVATWRALAPTLPAPAFFAGYSVGELSAYGCTRSLEPRDVLLLARRRATLMSECVPIDCGLMAIRGADYTEVARLCSVTGAHLAIINGPDRHVVGGTRSALRHFEAEALYLHWKAQPLPVDVAAHTPLLQSAAAAFEAALEKSTLGPPEIPVLAGVNARAITTRADAIAALAMQLVSPIDWQRCTTSLIERGCRVFLELPPGRALTQMLCEQYPQIDARAVEDFRSLEGIHTWLRQRLSYSGSCGDHDNSSVPPVMPP
jgi:[acyl-carrier-protein] S-malonyltransferase